jgi:bifunctional non-homologous end joining protein LigD
MANHTFPDWIVPMAATLTQDRFTGPEWVFERKFDGIRLLAFKQDGEVRLFSRNRLQQHSPAIAGAVAALPPLDLILDGEMSWPGLSAVEGSGPARYDVFDVVWMAGNDLRGRPLDERRAQLAGLPFQPPLYRVEMLDESEPWTRACSEGWEGVIAKRRDSLYEHRRSPHWLKMKCEIEQELVVGGFTDPQGRRVGLGALLVGFYENDDFVFAGKIGTGFDTKLLLSLRARLDRLEVPKAPFTRAKGLPRLRAHWVRPEIVVKVGFIEWTGHRKLRHPRLLAVQS